MVNKSDLDDNNYYSQSDMEKIFVNGVNALSGKKEITQVHLKNVSNQNVRGLGSIKLTPTDHAKAKGAGPIFHNWYHAHKGHHGSEKESLTFDHEEKIQPGNFLNCNSLTDLWFQWFLTTPISKNPYSNPGERSKDDSTPYGGENVFLMERWNTSAYFTTASAFQDPADVKTITLLKAAPLLVPAYNVYVSEEQFPSLSNKDPELLVEVISDLLGIIPDKLKAKLDGQTLEPCCVIRKKPLRIPGIPVDNVIGLPKIRLDESDSSVGILHGGFWMLIRPEALESGDHVLEWNVDSVNYKMNAEIRINALI
jgi:hypothetical protein